MKNTPPKDFRNVSEYPYWHFLTGDELMVVKADAVVELQFDIIDNQRLAVLVY